MKAWCFPLRYGEYSWPDSYRYNVVKSELGRIGLICYQSRDWSSVVPRILGCIWKTTSLAKAKKSAQNIWLLCLARHMLISFSCKSKQTSGGLLYSKQNAKQPLQSAD